MADIIQAAKWLDENRPVRRKQLDFITYYISEEDEALVCVTPHDAWVRPAGLRVSDILADDWEAVFPEQSDGEHTTSR